jgi:cytochrome c-type biogenesis protein CcmH
MTLFWILSAALLLVAVLFVALPLWRSAASDNDVLRDAANLGILRDQSTELEEDLRNGLLTRDAYEQGKRELQVRLIEEVKTTGRTDKLPRNPARVLAITLAVLLPVFSVAVYLTVGSPDAVVPPQAIATDADGLIRSDDGLQQMEKKLQRFPKSPNDWWTLARSYTELKRFPDAARAYEHLVGLVPNEPQLWANYAEVYAMAHGQTLQNTEVSKFLAKSLELDPANPTALALSGSAAMERGDFVATITNWQKLVDQAPPGSEDAKMYLDGIKRARKLLAEQPGGKEKLVLLSLERAHEKAAEKAAANTSAVITGVVSLSPALAGKVAPTDTVFILARAAQGPKMPLAVLRAQVKDLPAKFTLDDSMAMQPQLKLSGFKQVVVVARVSKSGTPMAQPGDLQGLTGTVKPGIKGLNIVIDSVVP